jgi:hypothetical protein
MINTSTSLCILSLISSKRTWTIEIGCGTQLSWDESDKKLPLGKDVNKWDEKRAK